MPSNRSLAFLVAAVASLVVLSGCGSGSPDSGAARRTVEAGATGGGSSDATSESSDAPSKGSAPAACKGAQELFLETADDLGDGEFADEETTDWVSEQAAAVADARAIAELADGSVRADLDAIAAFMASEPPAVDLDPLAEDMSPEAKRWYDEMGRMAERVDRVRPWIADTCPLAVPAWACSIRRTFTPVGQSIDPDGEPVPGKGSASPREATGLGAEAVEIVRTPKQVAYGIIDDHGLVTRRVVARKVGGTWTGGPDTECGDQSGASAKFTPVGKAED